MSIAPKKVYYSCVSIICPKCDTKDPTDFYLGKLKLNESSEATRGKHWIQMVNMELPRCKRCDTLGITEEEYEAQKLRLLHAMDPQAKADFQSQQKTSPKQYGQVILLWTLIFFLFIGFAALMGWI